MDRDPYELLGVSENATTRELERARRYAHQVLRDISSTLGPDVTAARAAELDHAWNTLRDPATRPARATAGQTTVSFSRADGDPGRRCSVCCAMPAKAMHFRVRRNKKLVESIAEVYCRTCGIATFRDATNQTLRQGFWRARTIVTTVAIVRGNARERRRIAVLRGPDDPSLALHPGRPLWLRSGVVTLVISVSVFSMTVAQVADVSSLLSDKHGPLQELPFP